jgi:hypothetical protein
MKKRFDVTVASKINPALTLYGLPEAMPLERELLARRLARDLAHRALRIRWFCCKHFTIQLRADGCRIEHASFLK